MCGHNQIVCGLVLLILLPASGLAWQGDVCISTATDLAETVSLIADSEVPSRLYALLGHAGYEIVLSTDLGESWSPLVPATGATASGRDLAITDTTLCIAQVHAPYLTLALHSALTGDLLETIVLKDDLLAGGDLVLLRDPVAPLLYLATVIDQGGGPTLYFTRSFNGGHTWQDGRLLAWGNLERIDLTAMPGSDGRLLLAYWMDGGIYLAINFDCGHSEYWGDVYGQWGSAVSGSRPAVTGQGEVGLVAWTDPAGEIVTWYSTDGGTHWIEGDPLGTGTAPVLRAESDGLFHAAYTGSATSDLFYCYSWAPWEANAWSTPIAVNDAPIVPASETTALAILNDHTPNVGALFVSAGDRLTYFDVEPRQSTSAAAEMSRALTVRGLCAPLLFSTRMRGGSLEILDLQGRHVRTLPAGPEVLWDGRNAQGHAVQPGIYLARLRPGTITRKIVLVR